MKTVKIFVYGTLKKGFRNHDRFCGNAIGIEPATVNGKLYDTGWGFPAMQLSDNPDDIVHGEIITLPEADLPAIDRLEGVPPPLPTRRSQGRERGGNNNIGILLC